jgi:hypothetical protein
MRRTTSGIVRARLMGGQEALERMPPAWSFEGRELGFDGFEPMHVHDINARQRWSALHRRKAELACTARRYRFSDTLRLQS